MKTRPQFCFALALGALLMAANAMASVVAVGPGAFGATPILNFNGLADNTEVNGLAVGGLLFTYSLGNGQVVIDGGPGITNNIAPPNIVSIGNNTGILGCEFTGAGQLVRVRLRDS